MNLNILSDGQLLTECIQLNIKETYLDFIINHYKKYEFITMDMTNYTKNLIKTHYKLKKYFENMLETYKKDKSSICYYDVMLYNEFHQYGILTKKQIKQYSLFKK